ncbi:MAG TPA: endonuclease/exonuclease/phosphatase family protein [Anaerolineaceae bacterium]
MARRLIFHCGVLFAFLAGILGCTPEPSRAKDVLISQVLTGVNGNNNLEFIELYNPCQDAIDLKGYALFYRLPASTQDLIVYRWRDSALIPPQGFYLLGRAGEKLALLPEAEFNQPLNPSDGGLVLRKPDNSPADALGWGKAPAGFFEGKPAASLDNGIALERLPGGMKGNAVDTQNNRSDFKTNPSPSPHNTNSPPAPLPSKRLAINVLVPIEAQPGSSFHIQVNVENLTGQPLQQVTATIPLPEILKLEALPDGASRAGETLTWIIPTLANQENRMLKLSALAPWTYTTIQIANYFVQAENWLVKGYGGVARMRVEGGVIPINVARSLDGAEVTIEGIATAYTGAYFAGNGNNKFYLTDGTGGIQVQVFGGERVVSVKIGDQVRVRGKISNYRDSMQIAPIRLPDDVKIIAPAVSGQAPKPTAVPLKQATEDRQKLPGSLIQVEGAITRVEEFTYSYEIDLAGEQGSLLTMYIDKQTNIGVDTFESGQRLRATGILDGRDAKWMLYPRLQADLEQVYPPEVRLEIQAPNTIAPNGSVTVTLAVYNHMTSPATDLQVSFPIPQNAKVESIQDGGKVEDINGNTVASWKIPALAGNGASASLRLTLQAGNSGYLTLQKAVVNGSAMPQPAFASPRYIFIGGSIPVWAIQGTGFRSPYVASTVTTQGVVTGIFPDLSGFWIQEIETDSDPRTSSGIFINTAAMSMNPGVKQGDLVEVSGTVREASQQTAIFLYSSANLRVIRKDQTLPQAIELDPPTTVKQADVYYESLEGMAVQVNGTAIAVSPTSHYGEYVVVHQKYGIHRLFQGQDNGIAITVDDGSNITYTDRSKMAYAVQTGDKISNLKGVLAFTYGKYKIEPLEQPKVESSPPKVTPLQPAGEDEISVMTWNALNMFDLSDPHPTDPPRPTAAEYRRDLTKMARTIIAAGAPLVVGLQEIENIGILQELVKHDLLSSYKYQPVLIEGSDSRGIDVGYLIRTDRLKLLESKAFPDSAGIFSRPPLLVRVQDLKSRAELFILNNHFVSMSGGVEATEPRRVAQAAWNMKILDELDLQHPQIKAIVLGDLNSYYQSAPIDVFRKAGMKHAFEFLPTDQAYTYIYQGESQTLDHILMTANLAQTIKKVEVLHVNSDYPPPDPTDDSPLAKSDHDPVVVTFTLK